MSKIKQSQRATKAAGNEGLGSLRREKHTEDGLHTVDGLHTEDGLHTVDDGLHTVDHGLHTVDDGLHTVDRLHTVAALHVLHLGLWANWQFCRLGNQTHGQWFRVVEQSP